MKSRPYGSWTRQDNGTIPRRERRRRSSRRPSRDRRRSPGGLRYDRLLLVGLGVVLISLAFGLVLADVRRADEPASQASSGGDHARSKAMYLTVPSMKRVKNVPVYGHPIKNKAALHDGTLHVNGTGFPWQKGSNVYIAGHRIGYPRTDSFFVFWDLHKLHNGRRVVLTDAEGKKYVYRVFDRFVVRPDETSVKKPVEGRNIVSLQTCTLPNYSERLIVRAELVRTLEAPVRQASAGPPPG